MIFGKKQLKPLHRRVLAQRDGALVFVSDRFERRMVKVGLFCVKNNLGYSYLHNMQTNMVEISIFSKDGKMSLMQILAYLAFEFAQDGEDSVVQALVDCYEIKSASAALPKIVVKIPASIDE